MTALETDILNGLIELDWAVNAMASANPKPDLRPLFARLDDLARQLPKGSDPDLVHYLHKKSYQKARLLLEQRGA
ncbi:MAG TPA: hypothetical protein VG146_01615 [Verrucomicrobiae bacterium]|nr:hypothetical protein [Verrucomicrobiae bacterium]